MNEESTGLIIFALIALAAVFAFIFILGGPEPETTGRLAGSQKLGTSNYIYRDAATACSKGFHCNDGMPGVPTGVYNEFIGAYQCRCQTADRSVGWPANQGWWFYRSKFR